MKSMFLVLLLAAVLAVPESACNPMRISPGPGNRATSDPDLTVETTILRDSGAARHALQHYTTDGKSSISTGADGDEFHTCVVWSGQGLVFSVEEHTRMAESFFPERHGL
jgi:hypothetical protein